MTTRQPNPSLLALAVAFAALTAPVKAQSAAGSSSDATPEKAVQLPTFNVQSSQDNGYIAADEISASRLATNMLKTPSDDSVLTKDFINDLNVFNVQDALKWLPGAFVNDPFTITSIGDPRDFGNNVTFRGLPTGATTRNFFNYSSTVEDYVLERIDGTRGPNSILYGTSLSGGSINATTKQAQWRDFVILTPRTDSHGSQRLAIDVNEEVTGKLAMRLNMVEQDQRLWMDRATNRLKAADFTATYRPWHGGEFRVDAEASTKQTSLAANNYYDGVSLWDRSTITNGPLTASPASSTGLSRYTSDTIIYSNAWSGALNLLNYAKTVGTNLSITPENQQLTGLGNFPVISRESFNAQPPNLVSKSNNYVGQVFYNQTFDSGLVTELAFSSAESRKMLTSQVWTAVYIDPNKLLPNGQPNPEYGHYYSDTTLNADKVKVPNFDTSVRASAAYPITTNWMNQVFSLVASEYWSDFDPVTFRPGRSNGSNPSITATANLITYRQYFDQLDVPFALPTDSNGYAIDYAKSRDTTQASRLDSIQLNSVGSYFGDRLTVIGGLRRDLYTGSVRDIATFNTAGAPGSYSYLGYNSDVTSFALGATYFPIKQAGVYANYSEGFSPSLQQFPPLPGRPTIPATTSNVRTAGFRFRLLDGKVVGSLGYYDSREKNRLQSVSTTYINRIWQNLNLSQNDPTVLQSYFDTFDYKAHGYEADITANVTSGLRLILNGSLPKTEQANSLPGSKAYLAENLAQWQAGANDLTNPNHAQIASDLATYENTIASAVDGRPLNGTFKWTMNAFGVYEFQRGWIKGLSVGGGVNEYGRRLIGNQVNQPFSYLYADGYGVATALLGYHFTVGHVAVDVQLNLQNLFDYSKPVYTSTTVYNGVAYRGAFAYQAPRTAVLSAKIQF